jgi:hypothetical protein
MCARALSEGFAGSGSRGGGFARISKEAIPTDCSAVKSQITARQYC